MNYFTSSAISLGGLQYKKEGDAHWKFWKDPLRCSKILFSGCGLILI